MNDLQFYIKIAIWSQVVSSVVFFGVLAYIWSRWIYPVVMTAQERSNRQIAKAEHHRDEAKDALETLRQENQTAHHDAELIAQRVERSRRSTIARRCSRRPRRQENARSPMPGASSSVPAPRRVNGFATSSSTARCGWREATRSAVSGGWPTRGLVDRFVGSLEGAAHG